MLLPADHDARRVVPSMSARDQRRLADAIARWADLSAHPHVAPAQLERAARTLKFQLALHTRSVRESRALAGAPAPDGVTARAIVLLTAVSGLDEPHHLADVLRAVPEGDLAGPFASARDAVATYVARVGDSRLVVPTLDLDEQILLRGEIARAESLGDAVARDRLVEHHAPAARRSAVLGVELQELDDTAARAAVVLVASGTRIEPRSLREVVDPTRRPQGVLAAPFEAALAVVAPRLRGPIRTRHFAGSRADLAEARR